MRHDDLEHMLDNATRFPCVGCTHWEDVKALVAEVRRLRERLAQAAPAHPSAALVRRAWMAGFHESAEGFNGEFLPEQCREQVRLLADEWLSEVR